jgi:hypothetical protein
MFPQPGRHRHPFVTWVDDATGVQQRRDRSSSARAGARASSEPIALPPRNITHETIWKFLLDADAIRGHLLDVVLLTARQPIVVLHTHAQPAQHEGHWRQCRIGVIARRDEASANAMSVRPASPSEACKIRFSSFSVSLNIQEFMSKKMKV